MEGNHELTINMLLKGGKNVTRQETANLQSLHLSARTGDIAMIKDFHKEVAWKRGMERVKQYSFML